MLKLKSLLKLFKCNMFKKNIAIILAALTLLSVFGFSLTSCGDIADELFYSYTQTEAEYSTEPVHETSESPETDENEIDENGSYDDRDSVALYIHIYGKLPQNYITKAEAKELGWNGGSVEEYAPGKCIGGSVFSNFDGLLPKADGRKYYECDIGTLGKASRGAERIVFSNDGLIYYTADHYETFELLYGDE